MLFGVLGKERAEPELHGDKRERDRDAGVPNKDLMSTLPHSLTCSVLCPRLAVIGLSCRGGASKDDISVGIRAPVRLQFWMVRVDWRELLRRVRINIHIGFPRAPSHAALKDSSLRIER